MLGFAGVGDGLLHGGVEGVERGEGTPVGDGFGDPGGVLVDAGEGGDEGGARGGVEALEGDGGGEGLW